MRLEEFYLDECVHFGAFRYGKGNYHPYETYVHRLCRGEPLPDIRAEFEEFLRGYRPKDLGDALGIELERRYPLWLYPWQSRLKILFAPRSSGWYRSPGAVPDIITSFSARGISRARVVEEFGWLEQVYFSIVERGYRPDEYGYPRGRLLECKDRGRVCLLLDGNHRASALSAVGQKRLLVAIPDRKPITNADIDSWHGVRTGVFTRGDAARIFSAYFDGNSRNYSNIPRAAIVD